MADAEGQKKGGKGKEGKSSRQADKAAEQEAKRLEEEERLRGEMEKHRDIVGDLPLLRSRPGDRQGRQFTLVRDLNQALIGQTVLVRARVHNVRATSKVTFLILRDQYFTCQATVPKHGDLPEVFVAFVNKINKESLVDVEAEVFKPESSSGKVDSATQHDIELKPRKLFVVSRAAQVPLQIPDLETPQPLLDEQDAIISAIEAKIVPLQTEIQAIQERPKQGKNRVQEAVNEMNAKRKAAADHEARIADLRKQLEAAEAELGSLKQQAEDALAHVNAVKEAVKQEGPAVNTAEEKKRITELQKQLKPLVKEKENAYKIISVGLKERLDNRVIDLRTTTNQAIFRIQSGVCTLFREVLLKHNFVEIHSPKLIGTASEGGANVFKVGYFETDAYLAQSPQFYKQMAVNADLQRVFEIAPVFRAENSNTHRHMTEFMGLDLEMAFKEHYHEVLDMLEEVFLYIFDGLNERFRPELEAVRKQFPFEDLKYSRPSLRLRWPDIIQLLRANGEEIGDYDDISTTQEKLLGRIIREKHGVDFYLVDKFPIDVRPFYTMIDPDNEKYSNSYDFFLRGEEICSGAQRIHDPQMLLERAAHHNVEVAKIQAYVDAFKYGAYPHAGGGVGMERVVMLFLGLNNIRRSCLFPRDPKRLSP